MLNEDLFWNKVDKTGDCWNWTACIAKNGYGKLGVDSKTRYAHRISYELAKGAIPDGLLILHTCCNRKCVNPKHLYAGDYQMNAEDIISFRMGGSRQK